MPTYRDDLHLGHKVPMVETDDITNGSITEDKIGDGAVTTPKIKDGAVTTDKIDDGAVTNNKIADNSITGRKIANKSITEDKLSDRVEKFWLMPILNRWFNKFIKPILDCMQMQIKELDKKVDSTYKELRTIVVSSKNNGVALSDRFGNNDDIGITQKTLTEAINSIWKKLEQITGEPAGGIDFTVTPDYFIAENECTVHITAIHGTGVFEYVKFYVDDVLVTEAKNVKEYHYDTTIDKTCEIKCVASILGIEYMDKKTVTKYFPFFIGSGSKWDDIVKSANSRPFDGNIKGEYDVRVENEGDHIFIIIPASLKDQIVRADMNGFEIPFTITNTDEYIIYSSDNTYRKGVYGIDLTANCVCPC